MGSKVKNPPQKSFVLVTCTDRGFSSHPHTASAFTDNVDLQLEVVCGVSLMPVAQVTATHPQPGRMEQWDHVPTLLPQQDPNTTRPLTAWCCLLAWSTHPASALTGSGAPLRTQLLLKWESPECTKPPRKPQKVQDPHLPASFQPLLGSRTPAEELPQCDRTAMAAQESTSP